MLHGGTEAPCLTHATFITSAWWGGWRTWAGRSGGSVAHRTSPSPFFVDRGHFIGMRDISNTPASRTLLSIFIQQIHSGHPGSLSQLFGGDSGTSTGGRHRRGRGGGPCVCTSTSGEGVRWGGGDRTCSGGRNGSQSAAGGGGGGDGACSGGRDGLCLSGGGGDGLGGGVGRGGASACHRR